MSKNGRLIFKNFDAPITSAFGSRIHPITKVKSFHQGVDYGTNGKKLAQYALENGVITGCGRDSTGAKYVYVNYPRLKKTALHYHLDSYTVKNGQSVNENTIIGYTGQTGQATGIHLHFGWFPTEDRNKAWNSKRWENFEVYQLPTKRKLVAELQHVLNQQYKCGLVEDNSFGVLTEKACKDNYLYQGKKASIHVRWLQSRLVELGYDIGKYGIDSSFGNDTLKALKKFQKDRNLICDGFCGSLTSRELTK